MVSFVDANQKLEFRTAAEFWDIFWKKIRNSSTCHSTKRLYKYKSELTSLQFLRPSSFDVNANRL
jgi:hypothetical protein